MLQETWRLELFGPLRARKGAQEITRFRTQKTASLLAYLAYFLGRSQPREMLVERFWATADPRAGRESLSVALNSLRKQLEGPDTAAGTVLIADRTTLRLNPDACVTDVAEFESLLQSAAQAADDTQRIPILSQSVALYGNGLLPGYYEDWVSNERERLADIFLGALRRLVKCLAQAKQWEPALIYARQALHADPLREESHRTLMRLYAAAGRIGAVLEQFRELERILREELQTAPTAATRELVQHLTAHLHGNAPIAPAPTTPPPSPVENISPALPTVALASTAPSTTPPAGRIPAALTRFFGREEDLEDLLRLLEVRGGERRNLITLLGPGGAGKTRLALEAARRLLPTFAGAVWFVPLADVTDADLIPDVLRDVMALPRSETVPAFDQVCAALLAQSALLVLDNLEHLLSDGIQTSVGGDAAEVVHRLLTQVPGLSVLVTSRQALDLTMEQVVPLLPLATPSRPGTPQRLLEFASVQLFVDRAQARRADFQITAENAAAIGALCERLEGIPLALELAAAWAQTLMPAQMLTRLAHRFDLLVSKRRDLPARHLSLRAAIEGSYRLLNHRIQRFFVRLSVFRGGWTLEAAEAICAAEALEEVGAGKVLEALQTLQNRSLVLAEAEGETMRFRLLETLREFAEEQLDVTERAALQQKHSEHFLMMAEEIHPKLRGAEQARGFNLLKADHDNLRAALEQMAQSGQWEQGMRLGRALATFWEYRGHLQEGRQWLERMLAGGGEEASAFLRARAMSSLGIMTLRLSDYAATRSYHEGALALYRQLENKTGIAGEYNNLGNLARVQSDYDRARALFEESLSYWRELKEDWATSVTLNNLGNVALAQADYPAAQTLYEQSQELFRRLGHTSGVALTLGNLGLIAQDRGDLQTARRLQEESLALRRELGSPKDISIALNNLGSVLRTQGDYVGARTLLTECLAIKREIDDKAGIAATLANLAAVADSRQDYGEGAELWSESLRIRHALGDQNGSITCLEGLAESAFAQKSWRRAASLFFAARALRERIHAPRPPQTQETVQRCLETLRERLGAKELQALQEESGTWSPERSVAYALSAMTTSSQTLQR